MQDIKVAFRSGASFLSGKPHWGHPVGHWTSDINHALLFDARQYEDGAVRWPFTLGCCGSYSDGGEELEERFQRYMFPAGRPKVVQVTLKDRLIAAWR